MYIADLHIHSKYSRATSRDGDAPHLDLWARRKGIGLLGTGDFTHPGVAGRADRNAGRGGGRALPPQGRIPPALRNRRAIRHASSYRARSAPSTNAAEKRARCIMSSSCRGWKPPKPSPTGWRPSAISIPTGGPFWGWTAATCWKSRWTAARRPFSFPPISGRRTFRSSERFRIFPRWKNAMATCPAISTRWKPAFPPTRP